MAILVHDVGFSLVNLFSTLYMIDRLSGKFGNVSLNDTLHLGLDLLGQNTTTELLEESRVLSLELLNAGTLVVFHFCETTSTYKDFSQAVIWVVSTLSRRPLTPA
jgi:hypothetical protein